MTRQIACPQCERKVSVDPHQAGVEIACPACGALIQVARGDVGTGAAGALPEPGVEFPRRKIPEDELDMTPMVDVTFLLLIFFMVTAAFALQKSIEIPPTKEEAASQSRTIDDFQEDQDFVVVRVDASNLYWVSSPLQEQEKEAPNEHELLSQLRAARRGAGGGIPGPSKLLVLAHGDARHEFVVRALDAGTNVGMEEVKLATTEDEF